MSLKRTLTAVVVGLSLGLGLILLPALVAGALPAQAATTIMTSSVTSSVPAASYDPSLPDDEINQRFVRNGYLPINRWFLSSARFHSYFTTFVTSQISEKLQREMTQSVGMALGNTAWYLTGEITRSAVDFDILNLAGKAIDNASGEMGKAVVDTPMLAGTIVVLLVSSILWTAFRKRGQSGAGGPIKKIIGIVVVFALISVMSAAATKSVMVGDTFVPAAGSPGWVVKSISESVGNLAALPATAFTKLLKDSGTANQKGNANAADWKFSCDAYANGMAKRVSMAANADIGAVTSIINSLWTVTGVETWKIAQFGAENDYRDFMYCRLLDMNSSVASPGSAETVTKLGDGIAVSGAGTTQLVGMDPADSAVFNPQSSGKEKDASLIAWAACRTTSTNPSGPGDWQLAPGWSSVHDPAIKTDDCNTWWHAKSDAVPSAFEFSANSDDVRKRVSDSHVLDFIYSFHGNDVMAGTTAVTAYQFSAGVMLIIFGGLSIAVMAAKIYMLIFMLTLFIVMIASLFSKNDAMEKLAKMASHFLGITVFSFGITLILSVIALLTKILIDFGTNLWGAGNPVSLIWSGIAPILAVWLLHLIFKNILKVPSPMTPTGAFGWGAAGGAAGAAMSNGLIGRMKSRATHGMERKLQHKLGDGAGGMLSGLTGGRLGGARGRGRMDGGTRPRGGIQSGNDELLQSKVDGASPLTRRQQKTADRTEMRDALRARRDKLKATKTGMEGIESLSGSTPDEARTKHGGKVALGVWGGAKKVDRYLSSDTAGRKAMQDKMKGHLTKGIQNLSQGARTVRSKTVEGVRQAPKAAVAGYKAGQAAVIGAGRSAGRSVIGAGQHLGQEFTRETKALGSTASLLAEYAKEDPAEAWNTASRMAWNGTKSGVRAAGIGVKNSTFAVGHAAQVSGKAVKAVATNKVVQNVAVAGAFTLAAVSGPVGTLAAGGYVSHKVKQASTKRREGRVEALREFRADKAAAAEKAAGPAPVGPANGDGPRR